jgi:hypothetical protein
MSENKQLSIKRLCIKNFAGFEEFNLELGKLTMAEGDNGQGKSSLRYAFESFFDGGNPSELIRNGHDRAEILMELSDGVELKKSLVRGGRSTLKVTHPEFGIIQAGQTFLDKLCDDFSVNPAKLIACDGPDRVKYFLNMLPIELTFEQVESLRLPDQKVPSGHALKVLPAIRKELEQRRRIKHTQLDDKRSNISELRKSIPEGDSVSIAEEMEAANEALREAATAQSNAEEAIINESGAKIWDLREQKRLFLESGRSEMEAAIARIKQEWETKRDEESARIDAEIEDLRAQKDVALSQVHAEHAPTLDEHKATLARLEQRKEEEIRIQHTREMIVKAEEQEKALANEWSDLDQRVKRLDDLAASLTAELPIEGLEIKDEEIYFESVPWPLVNTAKQIEIAFKIALLRAKGLPFIFFDGLEALSSKNIEAFKEMALGCDRQIFTTRVTDTELTVKTYGEFAESETPELALT